MLDKIKVIHIWGGGSMKCIRIFHNQFVHWKDMQYVCVCEDRDGIWLDITGHYAKYPLHYWFFFQSLPIWPWLRQKLWHVVLSISCGITTIIRDDVVYNNIVIEIISLWSCCTNVLEHFEFNAKDAVEISQRVFFMRLLIYKS